jgi:transcriptional regulator with XRE-family HTH domain
MGRRSKKERKHPLIRGVLAQNVRSLRDHHFRPLRSVTARNQALARAADTSLSQIQRIIAQTLGPSVDMLEQLAAAFKVRPHDLVTPYFAATRLHDDNAENSAESAFRRQASG